MLQDITYQVKVQISKTKRNKGIEKRSFPYPVVGTNP